MIVIERSAASTYAGRCWPIRRTRADHPSRRPTPRAIMLRVNAIAAAPSRSTPTHAKTVFCGQFAMGDAEPFTTSDPSSRQTVQRYPVVEFAAAGQVRAIAVEAMTETVASPEVSPGRDANAGPRPRTRNGKAGTKNRGPGESPPYGPK